VLNVIAIHTPVMLEDTGVVAMMLTREIQMLVDIETGMSNEEVVNASCDWTMLAELDMIE
jgi:hypothetical protein